MGKRRQKHCEISSSKKGNKSLAWLWQQSRGCWAGHGLEAACRRCVYCKVCHKQLGSTGGLKVGQLGHSCANRTLFSLLFSPCGDGGPCMESDALTCQSSPSPTWEHSRAPRPEPPGTAAASCLAPAPYKVYMVKFPKPGRSECLALGEESKPC